MYERERKGWMNRDRVTLVAPCGNDLQEHLVMKRDTVCAVTEKSGISLGLIHDPIDKETTQAGSATSEERANDCG